MNPSGRITQARPPAQLTSFVGRDAQIADLRRLVAEHRLVTVTGTGGVGKTRLAMRVAGGLADEFAGGRWWVDLASITDPELVTLQVARAYGLPDQPGFDTADTVIGFVGDQQMLLVLDNCEHLRDAAAALATTLLSACPELRIVATSREPLGVAGEVTWLTPPLSVADEAVELFTERARMARPGFAGTADDAATVTEICRRLDGVPLAIELAATRVRVLSLTEILDGLDQRLQLLTGRVRTTAPHQRTLRASVDWSYALLTEAERVVFRRLAVFLGGCDLDAAHAVAAAADTPRYQFVDELAQLVDKSLVIADNSGPVTRYTLLETIRQFGWEKLDESGEADAVRTRHAGHYTAWCRGLLAGGQQGRIGLAEIELGNLRAAFAWNRQCGDVDQAARLASGLLPLWVRSRTLEGLDWFDAIPPDSAALAPATRARTLADKVTLEVLNGDYSHLDQAQQAVATARELADPALLAWALAACGFACCYLPAIALPYFAEALELAPAMNDDLRLSQILGLQAYTAFIAGDLTLVRDAAERGRGLADAVGDRSMSRLCRWLLGLAQFLSADLVQAAAQGREVVAQAEAAHDPLVSGQGLPLLGMTLAYQGDADGARAAMEAAVAIARDLTALQLGANLDRLALVLLAAGDVPAAVDASAEACAVCALPQLQAINGSPAAKVALASGDPVAARRLADEAVAAASGVHRIATLSTSLRVAVAVGDAERAERDGREALAVIAETGAYLSAPDVIECLGILATDGGSYPDATRLFGSAAAIRDRTGQVRFKVYDADCAAAVDVLRTAMRPADFEESWSEGVAMSTGEAIAQAQHSPSDVGEYQHLPGGWASLTATERTVARLAGEGLRNKDISTKLFVSARTVESHLSRIYAKLGLTSRVQLVQEATRWRRSAGRAEAGGFNGGTGG